MVIRRPVSLAWKWKTYTRDIAAKEKKLVFVARSSSPTKGANLERLGRYLKLFTDKVEHTATVEHVDLSRLSDEQLDELEKIIQSATPDAK